jgi:hypothetical protein
MVFNVQYAWYICHTESRKPGLSRPFCFFMNVICVSFAFVRKLSLMAVRVRVCKVLARYHLYLSDLVIHSLHCKKHGPIHQVL